MEKKRKEKDILLSDVSNYHSTTGENGEGFQKDHYSENSQKSQTKRRDDCYFILHTSISDLIYFKTTEKDVENIQQMQNFMASSMGFSVNNKDYTDPPNLILFIVVDQLRADEVTFVKNGFNYLYDNGVFFRNANYRHANTFTGVGHATLFTGGSSSTHGIVGNNWINYRTSQRVEVVSNPNYTEVSGIENITGSAPTYLESTTIGDEIILFTNESKSFGISGKDRASILPAGHLGKAFYFSEKTGRFISSTYYYDEYPEYVVHWNGLKMADSFRDNDLKWDLEYEIDAYHYRDRKYVPETPFGKDFPKSYRNTKEDTYYADLKKSPVVDYLTLDFAKSVILNEKLGKRNVVDLLSVSLSDVDYIQHHNGINSLEGEDAVYKVDSYLEDFFKFVDDNVGLDNTLLVLTADHGMDLYWEKYRDMGFEAGHIYNGNVVDPLNEYFNETFGYNLSSNLVLDFYSPNLYLDRKSIKQQGFSLENIEQMTVDYLMEFNDLVYYAFTRTEIMEGRVPNIPVVQKIHRTYHPKRSGEVTVIQKQHVCPSTGYSSHGSGYAYDTLVPIFFAGKDVPSGFISDRAVGPEDIAPTICHYLGLHPPTGSMGIPLSEVLHVHKVSKKL